ncbi:SRPBCC family protein [Antrihabitans cavernicola]|uniref:SRPBCC family protein n=1 Tax=Antrihabitans cavernicola TaxID=2495913 RepID=A0A5A7SGC4_9NOCA|nr:SRPBCC family protein [Spelaeibacter cavernicola]KAA0023311.1 SRPBCC family protein [Spelaeibacter cavernicola]
MSVSGSTEFDIKATPAQVLDAVAAIEELPTWSGSHKSAVVETRHDDGRPFRTRQKVGAAGITDEQVTDYSWEPNKVSWQLMESGQQSLQIASYTLTPTKSGTHVVLDLEIDVKIPMPGFVLKRILKGALNSGSKDFTKYVESRAARS